MAVQRYETQIGGKTLTLETGKLALLASGSVTARYGDTIVLATVVANAEPRDGVDYFPLMVDYEERLYASGKISGSRFIKREGRPSETAVLTARLIDRPLRPLFPKYLRSDLQLIVTVLSYDPQYDPDVISIIAASCAVMSSGAPFRGPVGAARVGLVPSELAQGAPVVYKGYAFILNPTEDERDHSLLDLVVAGTADKINMIEAEAQEIPDDIILKAIKFGHQGYQPSIELQCQLARAVADHPVEEAGVLPIHEDVKSFIGEKVAQALTQIDKRQREGLLKDFEQQVVDNFEGAYKQIDLRSTFSQLVEKEVRRNILENGLRPDGRALTQIRPISIETGIVPRAHGSALFTRGQTQALTVATLGGPGLEQIIETMEEDTTKRYMHHYNFPPYSTGEVKAIRGASRREIGHGALAERALAPVLPAKENFPYTIRLVSEILASNGSSSMAATCGSTLALMDAGVPIKAPVAGIAMGLVADDSEGEGSYRILTDLQGLEDFAGDMDFKIAGTAEGITAIQLDVKISGLTDSIIDATINQAKTARREILQAMAEVLPEPRRELSPLAPRILTVHIDPKRIGELIGPGGKMINGIIDQVGGKSVTSIDIEDDGAVLVSSTDAAMGAKAVAMIQAMMKEITPGEVITGTVTQIMKDRNTGKEIGAIVQLAPNIDGMIHISQLASHRVATIGDIVKVGDSVKVKVVEVDRERGRVSLTLKDVPSA